MQPALGLAQSGNIFFGDEDRALWSWDLATGVDSYLHTYALAVDDTSEALAEFMVQAGFQGTIGPEIAASLAPARGGLHRHRTVAGAAGGRLQLSGPESTDPFSPAGSFLGPPVQAGHRIRPFQRQFRGPHSKARGYPWVGRTAALDVRAWGGFINYQTPSTLEVDYQDAGVGVFVRSQSLGNHMWGGGFRSARRAYPDSSAIDRDTWSVEVDYDYHGLRWPRGPRFPQERPATDRRRNGAPFGLDPLDRFPAAW